MTWKSTVHAALQNVAPKLSFALRTYPKCIILVHHVSQWWVVMGTNLPAQNIWKRTCGYVWRPLVQGRDAAERENTPESKLPMPQVERWPAELQFHPFKTGPSFGAGYLCIITSNSKAWRGAQGCLCFFRSTPQFPDRLAVLHHLRTVGRKETLQVCTSIDD